MLLHLFCVMCTGNQVAWGSLNTAAALKKAAGMSPSSQIGALLSTYFAVLCHANIYSVSNPHILTNSACAAKAGNIARSEKQQSVERIRCKLGAAGSTSILQALPIKGH